MPAMTMEEAIRHTTQTNPTFEVSQADIRGVTYRTFKNIPATIGQLMLASREIRMRFAMIWVSSRVTAWPLLCATIQNC